MKNTRVEILNVEDNSGVSTKSGTPKPWRIRKAHCILFLDGGKQVGVIQIPKSIEPTPEPGVYDAEFGLSVDFQTREVRGTLVALNPVSSISDDYVQGKTPAATSAPAAGKKAA